MSRLSAPRVALAGVVALGLAASAAITVTPASYDFGKAAVHGMGVAFFRIGLPASAAATTAAATKYTIGRLTATIGGPNATEFLADDGPLIQLEIVDPVVNPSDPRGCVGGSQGFVCTILVSFRPKSLGPKTATLIVTDSLGNRTTAQLKGEGVNAICEMKVVFCNYAFLYSGSFGWKSTLSGRAGTSTETVDVTVVKGVAACSGSVTGGEITGTIVGPGLIAVEFDKDDNGKLVYRITVACPSPAWPPSGGYPGTPSRPAELGHTEQKTYDQPSPGVGMDLIGSWSAPSPDTDPANGVTGQVQVSWSLKPW